LRVIERHTGVYGLEVGCEIEGVKTVAGGMRERNCWRKGKDAEDRKTHDVFDAKCQFQIMQATNSSFVLPRVPTRRCPRRHLSASDFGRGTPELPHKRNSPCSTETLGKNNRSHLSSVKCVHSSCHVLRLYVLVWYPDSCGRGTFRPLFPINQIHYL
jgi:hypothetical protein